MMTKALHHFFSPSGRVGRQTWWFSVIGIFASLLAVYFAGGIFADMYYCAKSPSDYYYVYCPGSDLYRGTDPIADPIGAWLTLISLAVGYWSIFAINTKRVHDHSYSAWWTLLTFIPIVALAWLGFSPGDKRANKYGESP